MIIKNKTIPFATFSFFVLTAFLFSFEGSEAVRKEISKKGYTLSYSHPKNFTPSLTEDGRVEYKSADCTFVVMIVLYKKKIPRWSYYRERIEYQGYRVRKGISKILSGNSTLGGSRKTYYYLKEIRIDKKKREKTYLIFFEKYIDTIGGKYNVLVKTVIKTDKLDVLNRNINTGAFIFNTFAISYDEAYRD